MAVPIAERSTITTKEQMEASRVLNMEKIKLEGPEELEQKITSTSVLPRELNREEIGSNEESWFARRLNMLKMQAQQMAQQAVEFVKQQVKRVVIRAIMQAISAIISFIIVTGGLY